jgi:murein DD-endopeptidase MepM/ murein hydrolase activator NlpD
LDAEELADVEWQLKQSQTERARVAVARDGLRQRLAMFEAELNAMAGGRPALESKLAKATTTFTPGESDVAEVVEARDHLRRRVQEMDRELAQVTETNGTLKTTVASLSLELGQSQEARENLVDAKSALRGTVDRLEQHLSQARTREVLLDGRIAALEGSLGEANGRGEKLESERNFLQTRITGLEERLVGMRETQQSMISRLSERTLVSIDTFEQTVAMTGLDVNGLLSGAQRAGLAEDQGGPFIPGDYVVEEDPIQSLQASIALLDLQMDRWEGLQQVVRTLPLTAPLDQFRITSSYGSRRDPVNRRKSSHHGVDLAAPMRTPILSTAPGKVVYAGWKGRYGRVVVIDHGHGIRTRYAHLRKILVKVGQEVGHREKIALLGSSGRSTGPHVHYEVQVNGKPVDPMKFLRAGKYVFKS